MYICKEFIVVSYIGWQKNYLNLYNNSIFTLQFIKQRYNRAVNVFVSIVTTITSVSKRIYYLTQGNSIYSLQHIGFINQNVETMDMSSDSAEPIYLIFS